VNIVSEAFAAHLKRRIYLWVGDDAAETRLAGREDQRMGRPETTDAVAGEASSSPEQRRLLSKGDHKGQARSRPRRPASLQWLTLLKRAPARRASPDPYFGIKRLHLRHPRAPCHHDQQKESRKLKPDTTRSVFERKG
jgi:hypothetical protein